MNLATTRLWALGVTLLASVAMLGPLAVGARDSFPLSTYPMFTQSRGRPLMYQLQGRRKGGGVQRLDPTWVGTSEVLQAKVTIERAARGGRAARERLCRSVARHAARGDTPFTEIELIAARYDPIQYFAGRAEPVSSRRLTRCPVPGASEPSL